MEREGRRKYTRKPRPSPLTVGGQPVAEKAKAPLQEGMVRVKNEAGVLKDILSMDLDGFMRQYPRAKIVSGRGAPEYDQIARILKEYDIEQIRTVVLLLDETIPPWASADLMAQRIVAEGGIGHLETIYPDGGRGVVLEAPAPYPEEAA